MAARYIVNSKTYISSMQYIIYPLLDIEKNDTNSTACNSQTMQNKFAACKNQNWTFFCFSDCISQLVISMDGKPSLADGRLPIYHTNECSTSRSAARGRVMDESWNTFHNDNYRSVQYR